MNTVKELRKEASRLGIKNYTQYKKPELIAEIAKRASPSIKLVSPALNSKSLEIYKYIRANPDQSIYTIAKKFGTYYSVVSRVNKRYIENV